MSRNLVTKIGIAFIFVTFGIWEIIDPGYWSGFVPRFIEGLIDTSLAVRIHGVVLLILGIGVLSGIQTRKFGFAATLIMASIVLSLIINFGFSDILVRDIVILLFASTLVLEK